MHVCMSLYKTHTKHVYIQDTYKYSRRVRYGRKPLVCSNTHVKDMLQCTVNQCQRYAPMHNGMLNICSNAHVRRLNANTHMSIQAQPNGATPHVSMPIPTSLCQHTLLYATTHIPMPKHTPQCKHAHLYGNSTQRP